MFLLMENKISRLKLVGLNISDNCLVNKSEENKHDAEGVI